MIVAGSLEVQDKYGRDSELAYQKAKKSAELKRDDPAGRRIATKRLGWFGPSAAEAVPALVMLLEDVEVREEAVQSLRKIGPKAKSAIPALVAMKNESFIGGHAKDALKEIRGY